MDVQFIQLWTDLLNHCNDVSGRVTIFCLCDSDGMMFTNSMDVFFRTKPTQKYRNFEFSHDATPIPTVFSLLIIV